MLQSENEVSHCEWGIGLCKRAVCLTIVLWMLFASCIPENSSFLVFDCLFQPWCPGDIKVYHVNNIDFAEHSEQHVNCDNHRWRSCNSDVFGFFCVLRRNTYMCWGEMN